MKPDDGKMPRWYIDFEEMGRQGNTISIITLIIIVVGIICSFIFK